MRTLSRSRFHSGPTAGDLFGSFRAAFAAPGGHEQQEREQAKDPAAAADESVSFGDMPIESAEVPPVPTAGESENLSILHSPVIDLTEQPRQKPWPDAGQSSG